MEQDSKHSPGNTLDTPQETAQELRSPLGPSAHPRGPDAPRLAHGRDQQPREHDDEEGQELHGRHREQHVCKKA